MNFISSQLYSFDIHGQLTTSHDAQADIWLAVAEFATSDQHTTTKTASQQQSIHSKLSKKQRHHHQRLMVRRLLNMMLNKLGIMDTLDSSQYPYRLYKQQYQVSFSHSQNWVACAISRHHPIGIDIEKNPIDNHIAKRFFHPNTSSQLATLNIHEQHLYKQLCWMLAEALLKKNQGKQLGVFLRQDYSWIISQLLPIIVQSTQCKNLANKIDAQQISLIPPRLSESQTLISELSAIIYLADLSVLAT